MLLKRPSPGLSPSTIAREPILTTIRLAFSSKNGRELLPMLIYSARSQLQVGALLAVVSIFKLGI